MKRTLTFLAVTLGALSLASVAGASGGLGIFLDEAGTQNCGAPAAYTNVTLYLVARNIGTPDQGISGWECGIVTDPATLPAGNPAVTLRYGALNVLAYPNFNVGLPAVGGTGPGSTFVLASLTTFYLGGPIKFGVGPATPTSFPAGYEGDTHPEATAGYARGDNPGFLYRLYPTSFVPSGTAASYWTTYINVAGEPCPGSPVPTEADSWGGVKALYQ